MADVFPARRRVQCGHLSLIIVDCCNFKCNSLIVIGSVNTLAHTCLCIFGTRQRQLALQVGFASRRRTTCCTQCCSVTILGLTLIMALQYFYTCSLNSSAVGLLVAIVVVVDGVCTFNWNYPAGRKFRIFSATLNAASGYAFCHLLALSLVRVCQTYLGSICSSLTCVGNANTNCLQLILLQDNKCS